MSGVSTLTRNVEIIILGQKYVIKSDQDEVHLRQVARYVDEKLSELNRGRIATLSVAVLGALNIANEYHLYRQQMEALLQQMEERSQQLAELLEQQR
jgi:cell division protein ZapA